MRALVVGSSGGIGSALVAALTARGYAVTGVSRRGDGLDVTDEASVARVLGALEPGFDLVIVATGALEIGGHRPEKSLRAVEPAALAAQFAVNAMGPALVLKHALRLMPRDRRAVFAALSARVGSISDNRLGGWHAYRASKAALNMILRNLSVEMARSHPQAVIAGLHPGTVATDLSAPFQKGVAQGKLFTADYSAERLLSVLSKLTPADSGGVFAWDGARIPE